jgi:lactobin A/cerein 7B family class IIb bacteriocin
METKINLLENNRNFSEVQDLSADELMQIEGGILPIIAGALLWKGFVCGVGVCTALYGAYRLAQS